MNKSKLKNTIMDLKERAEAMVAKVAGILNAFDKLDKTNLIGSTVFAETLRVSAVKISEEIHRLVKEGGEALVSASVREDVMDESKVVLCSVLELVRYRYGSDSANIFEFFTPPNKRSFRYTVPKRLNCHEIVDQAHNRHKDDFSPVQTERFVAAKQVGEKLAEAHENYGKEMGEGKEVIDKMLKLLATSRKQISALRNTLKGELDNSDDVYNIIPRKRS